MFTGLVLITHKGEEITGIVKDGFFLSRVSYFFSMCLILNILIKTFHSSVPEIEVAFGLPVLHLSSRPFRV